jgi:hypothetical protein
MERKYFIKLIQNSPLNAHLTRRFIKTKLLMMLTMDLDLWKNDEMCQK